MSIPDILMKESGSSSISIILHSAYNIVDFPAPVLPTQPTFIPYAILIVKPFKTKPENLLYLIFTFLNSTVPCWGKLINYSSYFL